MSQYLIALIIDVVLSILAMSKNNNPTAKALGLTILCLGAWSLELFFLATIKDVALLSTLFHITRIGMFAAPSFFTVLTWRLLGGRSKIFKWAVIVPSFFITFCLAVTNFFILPSSLVATEGGYLPVPDVIYYAFAVYFLWCFLASLMLVFLSYKSSSEREKKRLVWLLITLGVCLLGGVFLIVVMPKGFYLAKFVGPITNIIFVTFLFYSTMQNNLMDFRLALSLNLSKAILLGFFVWIYFSFISVVEKQEQSSGRLFILLAFVALILEAYPRILRWILPNAKKMLIKHGYEFDQVKEDTEKALSFTINIPTMLEVLDHLFLKIMKVKSYKILMVESHATFNASGERENHLPFGFISENDSLVSYCVANGNLVMADEMPEAMQAEMKKQQAVSCFAVKTNQKVLAIVLVGSALNLTYYRYDDIKMFEWLASELGQVLQRLIRLDEMQEQLGEAKKTLSMLGIMSHYHHDIKAPFAIIDGVFANDLYDRDKQKDIVLAQVERGSKLIATMASILGGKRKRRVQSCALEAVVKDCLFVFGASIDKVEFEFAGIPNITGDAEDLKILFINIIKNASEARKNNEEIVLYVKSWMESAHVCFSIKDNGVGISEQQLANLWEQDYSAKQFGNGIGMQAIKRIADEHNARIEVLSQLGSGAEFIFRFPSSLIVDEHQPVSDAKDELAERRGIYTAESKNIK